jgi:hypothetical protein
VVVEKEKVVVVVVAVAPQIEEDLEDMASLHRTMEDTASLHLDMEDMASLHLEATATHRQVMASHQVKELLQAMVGHLAMVGPACHLAGSSTPIQQVVGLTFAIAPLAKLLGHHLLPVLAHLVVPTCHLAGKKQKILKAVRCTTSTATRTPHSGIHHELTIKVESDSSQ